MEVIQKFLNDRKEDWLKKRLKKGLSDTEIISYQEQASKNFEFRTWVNDASERAKQLTLVSHPAKFSHPRAQVTEITAESTFKEDGYLKTGNVCYLPDVVGNAGAIDVYKFLALTLEEDKTILEHLEIDTPYIRKVFSLSPENYENIRNNFLKIKVGDSTLRTHSSVKQVYFPIKDNEYNLLSILTPSGLMVELKNRVIETKFSEKIKSIREFFNKNHYTDQVFSDLYNLTIVGYGSGNPQGISILNNENSGKYYLLNSSPPVFEKRKFRLPTTDFFVECLYSKKFALEFENLKKHINGVNNLHTRKKIKKTLRQMVGEILFTAFCIRKNEKGWSKREHYESLSLEQRIWLDDAYMEQRTIQSGWRDEIARRISKWILDSFDEYCGSKLVSSAEIIELKGIVIQALDEDKEFF